MATTRKPERTGSVRRLLQESSPQVRYDTALGLARHEQLVASERALPEWANERPPSASPRAVGAFAKRAWWLSGVLLVSGALWLGTAQTRRAQPATPAAAASARASSAEPVVVIASRASSAAARLPTAVAPRAHAAGQSDDAARANLALAGEGPKEPSPPPRTELPRATGLVGPAANAASTSTAPVDSRASAAAATGDGTAVGGRAAQPTGASAPAPKARAPAGSGHAGPKARPRAAAQAPRDAEEMRQLAEAERLLGPDPVRALRMVREGNVTFRGGYFSQERRYIELMALFALGRHGEAHALAAWYLRDYPHGPYRHRVETEMLRYPVH